MPWPQLPWYFPFRVSNGSADARSALCPIKMALPPQRPCVFATEKENLAILRLVCVDHYILLFKYLSNHAFHKKTVSNALSRQDIYNKKFVDPYIDVF